MPLAFSGTSYLKLSVRVSLVMLLKNAVNIEREENSERWFLAGIIE